MSRKAAGSNTNTSQLCFLFSFDSTAGLGGGGSERIEGGQNVNGVGGLGGNRASLFGEREDKEDKINLIAIQSRSFLDAFIKTN